jgi:CRP-like cAMP-binding protein
MLISTNEKNAFLSELSATEYAALRGHLAPFELRAGRSLHYLGDAVDEVVFPHSGLVAMSMPLRDNPGAAAALIGRDGMVGGLAVLAGAPAASDAVVHIGGHASRISAVAFRQVLDQNPPLLRRMARYSHGLVAQSQQNALCHAVHPVEARICRWLLAIQARCAGDKVPLTQSTLAQMLGVRRTTVTLVAGRLEALGVIRCHRGYMQIVDQHELEQHSCECHAMLHGYVGKLLSASAESIPATEVGRAEVSLGRHVL